MPKYKWASDGGNSTPSFGRRMASKVISLIAKFESLSSSQTEEDPEKELPRVRSIESLVTPNGSISRKALRLRNSLGRKASRLFEKLERDKEENNPPPKRPPPRKKTLVIPRPTNRKQRRKQHVEGHKDGHLKRRKGHPSTFRHSRRLGGEAEDDTSSIGFDGLVSGNEPSSVLSTSEVSSSSQALSTSTPPVARILPSSFFAQLVPPEPVKPVKISALPKVLQEFSDHEISSGESFDPKLFRIGLEKQKSVWKRKITPPKISVKELISKFRVDAEEEELKTGNNEEELAMPTIDYTDEDLPIIDLRKDVPKATGTSTKRSRPMSLTDDKTPGNPPSLIQNSTDPDDKEGDNSHSDSVNSPVGISLVSSLTSSGSKYSVQTTGENGETKHVPGIINQKKKQTVGGSKTYFGINFSAKKMPTQQTTIHNNFGVLTDDNCYTAPARLDTPPPSAKKYRKTPPPKGFFRRFSRAKNSVSIQSSLATVTSESEDDDISELSSGTGTDSVYSTATTGTGTDSGSSIMMKHNKPIIMMNGNRGKYGLAIRTGIPAMPVLTPMPVSAIQNLAIERLVKRSVQPKLGFCTRYMYYYYYCWIYCNP
ncbi:hypothetical protein EDC01DRAFT_426547 [Geopyxis carbonaria]|nr:hypothetical protein EDC01DRAFT_426547 [Geopyxis carbonaria]